MYEDISKILDNLYECGHEDQAIVIEQAIMSYIVNTFEVKEIRDEFPDATTTDELVEAYYDFYGSIADLFEHITEKECDKVQKATQIMISAGDRAGKYLTPEELLEELSKHEI